MGRVNGKKVNGKKVNGKKPLFEKTFGRVEEVGERWNGCGDGGKIEDSGLEGVE